MRRPRLHARLPLRSSALHARARAPARSRRGGRPPRGGPRGDHRAGPVPRLRGRRRHARVALDARVDADRPLAWPPTSASTTRRSRAATRWSCARPTASACSTTARSTACSSTASASSGAARATATRSSSAATGSASSTRATVAPPATPATGRRRRVSGRALSVSARAMAETIAVLSLKGGTGKTTTVRTLADVLRPRGLRVLAVDLDPQGNLSDYFDVPPDADADVADVLTGRREGRRGGARRRRPREPRRLAEVERSLSGKMGRELALRKRARGRRRRLRRGPHRLPAGARAADRQRARRRRLTRCSPPRRSTSRCRASSRRSRSSSWPASPEPRLDLARRRPHIADMRTVHSREA